MTLFEALTGGAFDLLNGQHSGEFDQNLSKKSNARGLRGGMGDFGIDQYIISFAKKVAIDFCQFFSQLLSILFSLKL